MVPVETPVPDAGVRDDSAAPYRLIADTIPHMVWTAGPDGAVDYVNQRVHEYTGLSTAALAGWSWRVVVHPEELERCLAAWTRALQSGERYEIEYRLRRADGAYRWHHGSAVPLRDAEGRVVRWFGSCVDIEPEVQSARILESMVLEGTQALRASEQRFRAFMDHSPAIAWIKDAQLRYTYLNPAHERAHGRRTQDVLGRDDYDLWPADVAAPLRENDNAALLAGERGIERVERVPYADGRPGFWLVAKFALPEGEDRRGVAGIAIDLTARIDAEEKAQRYASEVRELVGRLLAIQESERRRVAGELHDLIGQNLTAFGIELAALRHAFPGAPPARLDDLRALVEQTIGAIRGVMRELRPPELEEFGLVAALRSHVEEFGRRTGLKASLEVGGTAARLARDMELALFRIAQEALLNAAKHSGGSAVRLRLDYHPAQVRVEVTDDGQGFAQRVGARGARRGGWGLRLMRERAAAHGGSLRIEFPQRGTRMIVELPRAQGRP